MTLEGKLKAVIAAQVRGGFGRWEGLAQEGISCVTQEVHWIGVDVTLLEIILDSLGCKAAYGESWESHSKKVEAMIGEPIIVPSNGYWKDCTKKILDAWNSGEGNNYQAAISVAYSLLPNVGE